MTNDCWRSLDPAVIIDNIIRFKGQMWLLASSTRGRRSKVTVSWYGVLIAALLSFVSLFCSMKWLVVNCVALKKFSERPGNFLGLFIVI